MSTFQMGQKVWWVHAQSSRKWLTCPDCQGKKYLTVILGDDSQVTIDCAGCAAGYEPPRGVVFIYEWAPGVHHGEITGIEINEKETRYRFGCYVIEAENVFDSQKLAQARAAQLMDEHNKEEAERFKRKEKDARTWAWHVHHHRNCVKQAMRDLEYHTAKLEAAKTHKKQEKALVIPKAMTAERR